MLFSVITILLALLWGHSADAKDWSFRPSVFATFGNYSNGRSSESFAGYFSVDSPQGHVFSAAYDNITVNQEDWKYPQQTGIIGLIFRDRPVGLKLYYGHIQGDYKSKRDEYTYRDQTDFYNAELIYSARKLNYGLALNYLSLSGYKLHKSLQITPRVEWRLHFKFRIFFKPNYFHSSSSFTALEEDHESHGNFHEITVDDNRNLYSVFLSVQYWPIRPLFLKVGGFIGERAYYFDNDLLTIFNQDETQKSMTFAQLEFFGSRKVAVNGEYIYTSFDGYSINYWIGGLKVII